MIPFKILLPYIASASNSSEVLWLTWQKVWRFAVTPGKNAVDKILTAVQDRLRKHSKSFEGLLQLIPAKYYYGEEQSVSLTC